MMSVSTEAAFEVVAASKVFGAHRALDGCSLRVPPGVVCALVGRNGAGKTTLLQALAGLLRLDSGQLHVNGAPVVLGEIPPVAYMAQGKPLPGSLTVHDTLGYAAELAAGRFDSKQAREWVGEYDIPLGQRVSSLSGGQRAQVAIATAMACDVDVVALDEPMADLDPLARDVVAGHLARAAGDGRTIVVSSHAVAELSSFCDYVVVLDRGQVVLDGPVDEVADGRRLDEVVLDTLRAGTPGSRNAR